MCWVRIPMINLEVKYKQVNTFDAMGVLIDTYSTMIEPKQKDITPKFDSKITERINKYEEN